MLPGSWGAAQTGVVDFVPTPDDDATYWLHSIPLAADAVSHAYHRHNLTWTAKDALRVLAEVEAASEPPPVRPSLPS